MVLESTVICLDNGEFMRNGDFIPTRLQVQMDAANLVVQCKLRAHPESCVALLTMAPQVDLLVGLTTDNGKLTTKLYSVSSKGFSNFINGIRVAQLALKHRQNRNHKTRVILFVGSPVEEKQDDLVQLAKRLKKEKIHVDIVCFGETEVTSEKLKTFVDTLNGKDAGSHLVVVPGGANLQEALVQSSLLRGEDGSTPAVAISGGGGFDFGIDPNEDPELAMALRVSLEEQRQRQEQEARREAPAQPATAAGSGGAATPVGSTPATSSGAGGVPNFESMSEDEILAYALQISAGQEASKPAAATAEPMEVDEKKRSPSPKASPKKSDKTAEEVDDIMGDPAALEQLVSNLPGVDPKSDVVRNAMANAQQSSSSSSQKKGDKKDAAKEDESKKK